MRCYTVKIQSYADSAYRLASSGKAPTKAVAEVVEGKGLGHEKISRICALLNKKMLERDKTSAYGTNSGRIWGSRWPTAKPNEVLELIGVNTFEKSSSDINVPRRDDIKQPQSIKMSMARVQRQRRTVFPVNTKISSTRNNPKSGESNLSAEIWRVREMLGTVEEALKISERRIDAAELSAGQATANLQIQIDKCLYDGSMSVGEVMAAVKMSCPHDAAFHDVFDYVLRTQDIDPEAALGLSLTPEGQKDEAKIKRSSLALSVQQEHIQDALTGSIILNKDAPLVKASRRCAESWLHRDDLYATKESLTKRLANWRNMIRSVLS